MGPQAAKKGDRVIHVPTSDFQRLVPDPEGDSAMQVVQAMSENQVRHALWAALVVCFGRMMEPALTLVNLGPSIEQSANGCRMDEATLILRQIALSTNADVSKAIDAFKKLVKERLAME